MLFPALKKLVLSSLSIGLSAVIPTNALSMDLTGYTLLRQYNFDSTADLNSFNPYGIAGTSVINQEWQRYQTFNTTNHKIIGGKLELTALANLGGVYSGGISSGQICSKEVFYPRNGIQYAFVLRAKVPKKTGAWPAFWLYNPGVQSGGTNSEIDIMEIFDTPTQNTFDWTGYDHGSGVGTTYYSIMTNQWVWHPGFDFSSDYHDYILVWQEGNIEKWVDNTQVKGTIFNWFGPDPQVLVNLAMGGSVNNNPTAASFPAVYSIESLKIYTRQMPNKVFNYECETRTTVISAGDTQADIAEPAASNGSMNMFTANAVNDYVEYTINFPQTGSHQIKVRSKHNTNRGIYQFSIGGVNFGSPVDQYNAAGASYVETTVATVNVTVTGNKLLRFKVTGKSAGSTEYSLSFDRIRLVKQ